MVVGRYADTDDWAGHESFLNKLQQHSIAGAVCRYVIFLGGNFIHGISHQTLRIAKAPAAASMLNLKGV